MVFLLESSGWALNLLRLNSPGRPSIGAACFYLEIAPLGC
jgi:hypothetical protein